MKKTTPPKNDKRSDKGRGTRPPQTLTRAVAQAVLEDAVMEAAADLAASSATRKEAALPGSGEALLAVINPETPEEKEILELLSVPFLGPTRVRALAGIGIRTLADLYAASPSQIGGVKGVGQRNAERIKAWLATQAPASPGMPPPPPNMDAPPNVGVALISSPDPGLAWENQTICDDLGAVDTSIASLRNLLGNKKLSKRLGRQFDKVAAVTSELAEGPDTLSTKQLQQAVALLERIASILGTAALEKKLSDKRQEALADELREQRKALQRAIGD